MVIGAYFGLLRESLVYQGLQAFPLNRKHFEEHSCWYSRMVGIHIPFHFFALKKKLDIFGVGVLNISVAEENTFIPKIYCTYRTSNFYQRKRGDHGCFLL